MKLALTVAGQALLMAIPVVSSLVVMSTPAQADTRSSSTIDTVIGDFSQPAFNLETLTDTDTTTRTIGAGLVNADADADALLFPEAGFSFSVGQTSGTGLNYNGFATGQSSLVSNFWVNANQVFSFSFLSQLELAAEITDPLIETATALGKIQFNLYDDSTNQLLDSFGVFGKLTPQSSGNPFQVKRSHYATLFDIPQTVASSSNSLFASSQFSGSYKRTFDGSLNLRLESLQVSSSSVAAVPEPDYLISSVVLLLMFPLMRYWHRRRSLS